MSRPGIDVIQLACAARADYLPHAAAMLHSALARTAGLELSVHFLHGPDLPREARPRMTAMLERGGAAIEFIEMSEERVAGLRTRGDMLPASHWYRIFLPELLPDVDKLLYLDADTIAVDSLRPLWEIDLDSWYVAAVTNVFQLDHLHHPERLGLASPYLYFNTGVLLMNLRLMRANDCTRSLLDYAREHHDEIALPEQDALNVVLGDRRLHLHPRWNAMNSVLNFPWAAYVFGPTAVEEARLRPAIRHFEGPTTNKPWHYRCDSAMRELYYRHRRETPWPDLRLEGRTPGNVARRSLRRVRLKP